MLYSIEVANLISENVVKKTQLGPDYLGVWN